MGFDLTRHFDWSAGETGRAEANARKPVRPHNHPTDTRHYSPDTPQREYRSNSTQAKFDVNNRRTSYHDSYRRDHTSQHPNARYPTTSSPSPPSARGTRAVPRRGSSSFSPIACIPQQVPSRSTGFLQTSTQLSPCHRRPPKPNLGFLIDSKFIIFPFRYVGEDHGCKQPSEPRRQSYSRPKERP